MRTKLLPEGSYRFRHVLLAGLERVGYVDEDTVDAACPCCGGVLAVRFRGYAPRADLDCHGGCPEHEVLRAMKRGRA